MLLVSEKINTAGEINAAGEEHGEDKGQREGKAPMLSEETPKKSKEQILQEEASLKKYNKTGSCTKRRGAKQDTFGCSPSTKNCREEELTGGNRRKEKAQYSLRLSFTQMKIGILIRAKLDLMQSCQRACLRSELQGENGGSCESKKIVVAEERAKAKRNKPMTQSQLKTYMMNYLKNQDCGEDFKQRLPKRLKEDKDDESKEDESTKKSGKRRKQMARKAMKTPSVATYKIIKQGEKGVYQIVREDGTDIVYINFGAMLKSISRDDLTELYRIVMNRYGMDGPEDKLEKGFWKCLRTMFEEPLNTDSIWSELGQQKIISWRYYDTCRVHCLNLESMDVYMLSERKYPLSAEVCQTMLKMKLLDGKMSEDCYRLLKMMEKQAGIRK
ncbi:hypothetical protein Tco_0344912 [Tanacetum coccineum]